MKRNRIIVLLFFLIAIAMVISQIYFGKNSLSQQNLLKQEIENYQHQVDSLQNFIDQRNITIERLKTDSLYIEELLRTKYGMSRKGEKVFMLIK